MNSTNETACILTDAEGEELPDETNTVKTVKMVCAIIKIVLIVFIVCGNGLAICSLMVFRTLRSHNGTMLLGLSIADLAVGLFACPLYSVFYLNGDALLCNRTACLLLFGTLILARVAPIHIIILLAVHQVADVTFPLEDVFWRRRRILGFVVIMVWAYSITLAILPLTGWNNLLDNTKCTVENTLAQEHDYLASLMTVMALVCLSGYLLFLVQCILRRRGNMVCANISTGIGGWKWRLQFVKLSLLIFLFRMLLWLPYTIMMLLRNEYLSWDLTEMVKIAALAAAFAGSFLNPLLYVIASSDFHLAFKTLLATPICNWSSLKNHLLVSGNEVVKTEDDMITQVKQYLNIFIARRVKLTTFNALLDNDYQTAFSQVFESIVEKMKERDDSKLFQEPASQLQEGKPMDLTTLFKNVNRGKYSTGQEFLKEVELIYTVAVEYYGMNTVYSRTASMLLTFCRQSVTNNAELIMLLETGIKEQESDETSVHSGGTTSNVDMVRKTSSFERSGDMEGSAGILTESKILGPGEISQSLATTDWTKASQSLATTDWKEASQSLATTE